MIQSHKVISVHFNSLCLLNTLFIISSLVVNSAPTSRQISTNPIDNRSGYMSHVLAPLASKFLKSISDRRNSRYSSRIRINSANTSLEITTLQTTTVNQKKSQIPTQLSAFQTPTVIKATAIEKLSIRLQMPDAYETYTLFKIELVYKLNDQVFEDRTSFKTLFSKAFQYNKRAHRQLVDSYLILKDFKPNDLNESYFLFLEENISPLYVTHPIRFLSKFRSSQNFAPNSKIFQINKVKKRKFFNRNSRRRTFFHRITKVNKKRIFASKWLVQKQQQQKQPFALVKVPIFQNIHAPVISNAKHKTFQAMINSTICQNCAKAVKLKFNKQVEKANLRQNVKLFCNFNGNPKPEIIWKKIGQRKLITNTHKYSVETMKSFSILTIKNIDRSDEGMYYCAARDYATRNGNLTAARIKLIVNSIDKTKLFEKKSQNNYKVSQRYRNFFNRPNNKLYTSTPALRRIKEQLKTKMNEYVRCEPSENACLNRGICFKTNPQINTMFQKKFCRCMRGFDGPNCEIAIVTQYHNLDMNEIPDALKPLWLDLGKNYQTKK